MRLLAPLHRYRARRLLAGAERGDVVDQFNLALSLEDAGDDEGAERWYLLAAAQGDPDARNNLGLLLDRTGRKPEALPLLIAAAEESGDAAISYNVAVLCEELGDQVRALAWYQRAAQLGDRDAAAELADRGLT